MCHLALSGLKGLNQFETMEKKIKLIFKNNFILKIKSIKPQQTQQFALNYQHLSR